MELEVSKRWYSYVLKRKQRLFLWWVKYFKPPLSKDLVRHIATNYFRVWVNPYKRLVKLAIPHYGNDSVKIVDEYLKRFETKSWSNYWTENPNVLGLLMSEHFLGVESIRYNEHIKMKRQIFPNVVFSNSNTGGFWIKDSKHSQGYDVSNLTKPRIQTFTEEK